MFKVVETPSKRSRTFKTWEGCFEYQRLLARQGRHFKVYEKINNKWASVD